MRSNKIYIVFLALLAMGMWACDAEEENFDWRPGPQLMIYAPDGGYGTTTEVSVGTPQTFSVAGYDIRRDYDWTVDGAGASVSSGEGEFLDVVFNRPGTYTITVSNDSDEGTVTVTAVTKTIGFAQEEYIFNEGLEADTLTIPLAISGDDGFLYGPTTITYEVSGNADGESFSFLTTSPLIVNDATGGDAAIQIAFPANLTLNRTMEGDAILPDSLVITLVSVNSTGSVIQDEAELDEDAAVTIVRIMDDVKEVGFAGGATMTITEPGVYEIPVELSDASTEAARVSYTLVGGDNPLVGVTDVSTTPGIIQFAAGETTKSVWIRVTQQAFDTAQEVTLNITSVDSEDEEIVLGANASMKILIEVEEEEEGE